MRLWSVPPLLALLFACLASLTLRAAEDPGALYLQAYMAYRAGERLEAEGKTAESLQKFRFCASVLDQLQKQTPDYEPVVVDYRLRKTRQAVARLQSLPDPGSAPSAPIVSPASPSPPREGASGVLRPPGLAFPPPAGGYRLPVPGQTPAPAPRLALPSPSPVAPGLPREESIDGLVNQGAIKALRDRIREMQMLLTREKRVNEDLREQLLESTAREQNAATALDRTKVRLLELQGRIDEAQRLIGDLQSANATLTRERDAASRRVVELEADLEVADEYNDELVAKLDRAGDFIEASEKIRAQLLGERTQLAQDANAKPVEVERLRRERDAAKTESEKISAQLAEVTRQAESSRKEAEAAHLRAEELAAAGKAKDDAAARERQAEVERLRAENVRLADAATKLTADAGELETRNRDLDERLSTAESKLAIAEGDVKQRDELVRDLRGQVSGLEKSLGTLRAQLADGGKRIAELERQLADTSAATATATGAMAEENLLLKSLVTRQLAEQARRQQARKLVAEELEKLQVRSGTLVEKLQTLATAEVALEPRERALFDQPLPVGRDGGDFVIEKRSATSDLPPALADRAREANQLSQRGQYADALAIYRDLVARAPRSHFANLNLGVVARQMGDYPLAISAFERALALKPGDALTLTNLGMSQFRADQGAAAVRTLEQAVAADGDNHLSHYFYALALNHTGDRGRARQQVERSLELKPDYAPAMELAREIRENGGNPSVTPPR